MNLLVRNSLLFILLAMAPQLVATERPQPAFTIQLPSVEIGYPGAEYWAEIQGPDGRDSWQFALFSGEREWTVPVPADTAGNYRLLRVEKRQGVDREDVALGENSQVHLEIEPSGTLSESDPKVLVEAGEFTTFFEAEAPWCVNDHTFAQDPENTWHLFGITHPKPMDFMKDPGLNLAHATSDSLLKIPWQAHPPAVTADWERYEEALLWAPYVLLHDGTYYMFVCAGDKGSHQYRINLLTSPDLEEWTRHPENPLLVDGFDGRDPMVLRVGDEWVMYYTANSTPKGGNHIIACVTSKDLVHWSNRKVAFVHPNAGTFAGPTESPFIVQRGDHYYLFLCDNAYMDVYLSLDPFHWDYERKVGRIHAHASEVVRDVDGKWYISHAGWMSGPLKMAPLMWHDGLDNAPTNIKPGRK